MLGFELLTGCAIRMAGRLTFSKSSNVRRTTSRSTCSGTGERAITAGRRMRAAGGHERRPRAQARTRMGRKASLQHTFDPRRYGLRSGAHGSAQRLERLPRRASASHRPGRASGRPRSRCCARRRWMDPSMVPAKSLERGRPDARACTLGRWTEGMVGRKRFAFAHTSHSFSTFAESITLPCINTGSVFIVQHKFYCCCNMGVLTVITLRMIPK